MVWSSCVTLLLSALTFFLDLICSVLVRFDLQCIGLAYIWHARLAGNPMAVPILPTPRWRRVRRNHHRLGFHRGRLHPRGLLRAAPPPSSRVRSLLDLLPLLLILICEFFIYKLLLQLALLRIVNFKDKYDKWNKMGPPIKDSAVFSVQNNQILVHLIPHYA